MLKALNETVIPKCKQALSMMENDVKPETEEIKTLHQFYIDAYKEYQTAFDLLKSAIDKNDLKLTDQANMHLKNARELQGKWSDRLDELKTKHDVVMKK